MQFLLRRLFIHLFSSDTGLVHLRIGIHYNPLARVPKRSRPVAKTFDPDGILFLNRFFEIQVDSFKPD